MDRDWRNAMAIPDASERPLEELISLSGRSAVVTGGARGLGRAIVRRLAEAGASVIIADIDLEEAEAAANEVTGLCGRTVLATPIDVASSASICAAADAAVARFGSLDIWVNNAGVYPSTPVLEMSDEDWERVIRINLSGTFVGCREAARRRVDSGTLLPPARSSRRWSCRSIARTSTAIRPGGSDRNGEPIAFRWERSRSAR